MALQIKNILKQGWRMPLSNDKNFGYNVQAILNMFDQPILQFQFVGIGASGAMILAGLAMASNYPIHTVLLRKQSDSSTSKNFVKIDPTKKIIIVDDDIVTGNTLRNIMSILKEKGCEPEQIIGVIATAYENDLETIVKISKSIEFNFPQVKFWFH